MAIISAVHFHRTCPPIIVEMLRVPIFVGHNIDLLFSNSQVKANNGTLT